MRFASAIFAALVGASACLPLQAGGLLGGLAGGFDALSKDMDKRQDLENQKALILQQHDLEMKRLEREHQLRMQADERAAKAAERRYQEEQTARAAARVAVQEAEKARVAKAESDRLPKEEETDRLVEAAHPGWKAIVNSKAFDKWVSKQPRSVAALAESDRVQDAILMIDLFKKDTKSATIKTKI